LPQRRGLAGERGSVTAEFATVIPAVFVVLAFVLGGFQLVTQQLRLADAASDAARVLGRGDGDPAAADLVSSLAAGATMSSAASGQFVCVSLQEASGFGPAAALGITVSARGCALAETP
jgi:Flp pilus assembly protein TadG